MIGWLEEEGYTQAEWENMSTERRATAYAERYGTLSEMHLYHDGSHTVWYIDNGGIEPYFALVGLWNECISEQRFRINKEIKNAIWSVKCNE